VDTSDEDISLYRAPLDDAVKEDDMDEDEIRSVLSVLCWMTDGTAVA
jgi:hypothetical protein